jgi:hypothetical protein
MAQEDLLNKKTLYTLTGASVACWGAVGIFNDIFHNSPPFSPTLLVLVIALVTSIGAGLSDSKKKKDFSLYLAVLFNTIMITTSALGIHGINQSGDSGKSDKETLLTKLTKSSIIPFIDKYPWLPPAKLVNEIVVKEEKIDSLKTQNVVLDDHVVVLKNYVSTSRQEKPVNKMMDVRSPRDKALEQEKQGYDAVARNDFKTAMQNFKNAEELYPMLDNNFEIYSYLKKNEKNFETNADELKKNINTKYTQKAPVKLDSEKDKTGIKVDKKTDIKKKEEPKLENKPKKKAP